MKMTCSACTRPARKFYRKAGDDPDLICQDCLLGSRLYCQNQCGSKSTALYPLYDDDGTTVVVYCKSCILSACEADVCDLNEYRAYLEAAK